MTVTCRKRGSERDNGNSRSEYCQIAQLIVSRCLFVQCGVNVLRHATRRAFQATSIQCTEFRLLRHRGTEDGEGRECGGETATMITLTSIRRGARPARLLARNLALPGALLLVSGVDVVLRAAGKVPQGWDGWMAIISAACVFAAVLIPPCRAALQAERQRQWRESGGRVIGGAGDAWGDSDRLTARIGALEDRLRDYDRALALIGLDELGEQDAQILPFPGNDAA